MFVQKPPMGFNTWNTFMENINEELIRSTADRMVESGLLEAGYEYLVIDDCWALCERDAEGNLVPDPEKFPGGMKAVADYVHSKGLKFGMYSCVGTMTCARYPGSFGYEYRDAKQFAEWGVDFLKYDYCFRPKNTRGVDLYRKMAIALKKSGRDILFSACSWGHDESKDWIDTTGANMWRATGDIKESWQHIRDLAKKSAEMNFRNWANCFSDLDMLIVGMNGEGACSINACTPDEYRTHFGFWAMVGSPLMIGCDIRKMDDTAKEILMNKDIIAVNQDPDMNRPLMIAASDEQGDWNESAEDTYTLVKLLENGDIAVGFFNFSERKMRRYVTPSMLGIDADLPVKFRIKDLWSGEYVEPSNETLFRIIQPHCCEIYRFEVENG